jgi:protein-tyrosine-phosphatase
MSILFICHANVGRSQAAMEFYNQTHPGESDSAGTNVDEPGQKLLDRDGAPTIIGVMKHYGIDMSQNIRKQLTPEMAQPYSKLVVIAEPETWPDWLKHDPRVEIWTIQDTKGQDTPTTERIVAELKTRVQALL